MPAVLPSDRLDYDKELSSLHAYVSPDDPIYRCVIEVVRRTTTAAACRSYVRALVPWFRWLRAEGLSTLSVTPDEVSDWFATQVHYALPTRKGRAQLVRAVYDEAVDRDLIIKNPARRLRVRGGAPPEGEPGLTQVEARRLLKLIESEFDHPTRSVLAQRDYALVYFFLKLGPRCIEARRLTWGDLGSARGVGYVDLVRKGGKRDRLIAPSDLQSVLETWRQTLRALRVEAMPSDPIFCAIGRPGPLGWVIPSPLQPLTYHAVYQRVRLWLEISGLTGRKLGPHRLRRSAATMAWEGHAELKDISDLMGHRNPQTTVDHYIKPAQRLARTAASHIRLKP
jgi:integrase/recombinase XerD